MLPLLARVDLKTIVIDSRYVIPSEWDSKVVPKDLTHYVQLSRHVKAMPLLRVVDGALVLSSGEPFLRAARAVAPPLNELICLIEADPNAVEALGLKILQPSQLLDETSPDELYEAVEMLGFIRQLADPERIFVEDQITRFYNEVSSNPSLYGGNYSSISQFHRQDNNRRVHWVWRRNDQFGRHSLMFAQVLRNVNDSIATVSSWNGLSPDWLT
jgi:hypothetical protein